MLSLASKAAAVYAEKIDDPAVVDAVGDIERLTTNLSQKIWQKITLVETDLEDVRGARAVSAGARISHMSRRVGRGEMNDLIRTAHHVHRPYQPPAMVDRLCDRLRRQRARRSAAQPGFLLRRHASTAELARHPLANRHALSGHGDHREALQRSRLASMAGLRVRADRRLALSGAALRPGDRPAVVRRF